MKERPVEKQTSRQVGDHDDEEDEHDERDEHDEEDWEDEDDWDDQLDCKKYGG